MSDRQQVIYAASSAQSAHLLRNLLIEAGIQAVVSNDVLEHGSGVDLVGWPTAARVLVGEGDAALARRIAEDFDRRESAARKGRGVRGLSAGAEPLPVPMDWPRCPECDAPRVTCCPVCGTAGTDFASADPSPEPTDLPGADEENSGSASSEPSCDTSRFTAIPGLAEAARGPSYACGPEGCSPGGPASVRGGDAVVEGGSKDADVADSSGSPLLLCGQCDEPFLPEYYVRCTWCGHKFPDGREPEAIVAANDFESLNPRVIAVSLGLAALLIALCVYLVFLV